SFEHLPSSRLSLFLDGGDFRLLGLRQLEGRGHFGVANGRHTPLLQRNFLEPLQLVWTENLGQGFVIGLTDFSKSRLHFLTGRTFAAGVVELRAESFPLLFLISTNLLLLGIRELQFLLDRFLAREGEGAPAPASKPAAAAPVLTLLLGKGCDCGCRHHYT